jgi:hypothetical protein
MIYLFNPYDEASLIYLFGNLKENKKAGLLSLLRGLGIILGAIYFFYNYYYLKKRKKFNDLKDVENEVNESNHRGALNNLFLGLIAIAMAYQLFYMYKPTNAQQTLALLLDHLRDKKIIDEEYYISKIKMLKPDNITESLQKANLI